MANNYQGWLLRFGAAGYIPLDYIIEYTSTPNQRMEDDAQRDQDGDLHRTTLSHTKTSIKFSTHMLHLDEKINLQQIMNYQNSLQRRVQVTYWNDETNDYSTGWFYLPDIQFTIHDASSTDLLYNPITIELVEY